MRSCAKSSWLTYSNMNHTGKNLAVFRIENSTTWNVKATNIITTLAYVPF